MLLLAFAVWFGRFAYLRITLEPTPRPEYWAKKILALDPPGEDALTNSELEDLLALDPSMALSPDGVTPVAVAMFMNRPWPGEQQQEWDIGPPLTEDEVGMLGSPAFVAIVQQWLAALERGWYPGLEGVDLLNYQELAWARQTAKWLAVRERYQRETSGSSEELVACWLGTLRLSRQVQRPQYSLTMMFGVSLEDMVRLQMSEAAVGPCPPLDTRDLMLRVDGILSPLPPAAWLEGEYLLDCYTQERYFVREGGDWMCLSAAWLVWGKQRSNLWNVLSPVYHDLDTARRNLDAYFGELKGIDSLAAAQRLQKQEHVDRVSALDGFPFEEYEVDTVRRYLECRTALEGSMTLLALREYERAHGAYPAALADLVPAHLPRLPIDHADREPLRYRRTADGYLLYSVGANGVDDGGVETGRTHRERWQDSPDMVFKARALRGEDG